MEDTKKSRLVSTVAQIAHIDGIDFGKRGFKNVGSSSSNQHALELTELQCRSPVLERWKRETLGVNSIRVFAM